MNPEIVHFKAQKVVFVRKHGNYEEAGNQAWCKVKGFADKNDLMGPDTKFFGICHDYPKTTPEDKIRYDACITVENDIETEDEVQTKTIETKKYAVFTHKGPYEGLKKVYGLIYSKWLPENKLSPDSAPCIEEYTNYSPTADPKNLITKIYIPVL